jgi:hypothetical protein
MFTMDTATCQCYCRAQSVGRGMAAPHHTRQSQPMLPVSSKPPSRGVQGAPSENHQR